MHLTRRTRTTGLSSRTSCAIRSRITSGQNRRVRSRPWGPDGPVTSMCVTGTSCPWASRGQGTHVLHEFPPLQLAASYNLEQVLRQVREMTRTTRANSRSTSQD